MKKALNIHFKGVDSRGVELIVTLIRAIFMSRDVGFSRLSVCISGKALPQSPYRRIQRSFSEFHFSHRRYIAFVCRLYTYMSSKKTLIMALGRTDWKIGAFKVNILMCGICLGGVCLPLLWKLLPQRAGCTQEQRIIFVGALLRMLPRDYRIEAMLFDRGFKGNKWLLFLRERRIPYVLRINKATLIDGKRIETLFAASNAIVRMKAPVNVFGAPHHIAATGEAQKQHVPICSHPFETPHKLYMLRWNIETLFGHLKSKGFSLENTRLTDRKKLTCLLFLLGICFVWAFALGKHLVDSKKVNVPLKHLRRVGKITCTFVPLYGIFRIGLDNISQKLFSGFSVFKFLKVLSCT